MDKAGDRLFTFTRLPPIQWRSARTTNAIERLHEEFKQANAVNAPAIISPANMQQIDLRII